MRMRRELFCAFVRDGERALRSLFFSLFNPLPMLAMYTCSLQITLEQIFYTYTISKGTFDLSRRPIRSIRTKPGHAAAPFGKQKNKKQANKQKKAYSWPC